MTAKNTTNTNKRVTKPRPRHRHTGSVSGDVETNINGKISLKDLRKTLHEELETANPARVRVEGSVTQNMGDFNSIRVAVCIERPCENTDEAIEKCYETVSEQVDGFVNQELDLATQPEEPK